MTETEREKKTHKINGRQKEKKERRHREERHVEKEEIERYTYREERKRGT